MPTKHRNLSTNSQRAKSHLSSRIFPRNQYTSSKPSSTLEFLCRTGSKTSAEAAGTDAVNDIEDSTIIIDMKSLPGVILSEVSGGWADFINEISSVWDDVNQRRWVLIPRLPPAYCRRALRCHGRSDNDTECSLTYNYSNSAISYRHYYELDNDEYYNRSNDTECGPSAYYNSKFAPFYRCCERGKHSKPQGGGTWHLDDNDCCRDRCVCCLPTRIQRVVDSLRSTQSYE